MKTINTLSSLAAVGLLGAVYSAPAAALAVDGSLLDWNVTVADHVGACGTDNPASCIGGNFSTVSGPGLLGATVAGTDTNDRSNNYIHIPPYLGGGQNYDVEFIAAGIQGNNLFIAISTGQRPDNGVGTFSPGDIKMVVNGSTTYGIEVGGGLGHNGGPAVGAITEGAAGSTYNTDTQGHTTSLAATPGAQVAGSIWKTPTWLDETIPNVYDGGDFDVQFTGGTLVTTADYIYTLDSVTTQHAIIELAFDVTLLDGVLLDGTSVITIQWQPNCGNDMELIVAIPEQRDIPTPAALPLLLAGLGGFIALRRRKTAA